MLCQLSYAPRPFVAAIVPLCSRASARRLQAVGYGYGSNVSENEHEAAPEQAPEGHDPVAEAQQGKGYGEDEGEREDSLDDD